MQAALLAAAIAATPAMAFVRVIHASPDTPPVDIYVNQIPGPGVSPAVTALPFTQDTGYIDLPTGTYDFRVTATGSTAVALPILGANLNQNDFVTVAAINFLSNIEPLVLVDDNTIDPMNARIRFVHASPDAPNVDIRVAGGGPTLFSNVAFGENGGYVSVPGGSYDLEVFVSGTNNLALSVPGLGVENGFVYSVFAMGDVANLEAVPFVDAPSPGALGLLGAAGLLAGRRRR
ncbi:MAG: DUF4397 domain-containing protein [Phycisphaerales bacterium]